MVPTLSRLGPDVEVMGERSKKGPFPRGAQLEWHGRREWCVISQRVSADCLVQLRGSQA